MPQTVATPESRAAAVHLFRAERLEVVDARLPLSPSEADRLGLVGLHCGCGANLTAGCLNTDEAVFQDAAGNTSYSSALVRVGGHHTYLRHDATEPFPIEDACFEWVYTEHLIEHLSLPQGVAFLREMRRVLKPGGFIRLSTPDLAHYAAGYLDQKNTFFDEHARRLEAMGLKDVPRRKAWAVNQIFYRWGHRWIYDLDELRLAAASAGFDPRSVVRRRFRDGRDAAVAAFDLPVRNDESMYVEITKE